MTEATHAACFRAHACQRAGVQSARAGAAAGPGAGQKGSWRFPSPHRSPRSEGRARRHVGCPRRLPGTGHDDRPPPPPAGRPDGLGSEALPRGRAGGRAGALAARAPWQREAQA